MCCSLEHTTAPITQHITFPTDTVYGALAYPLFLSASSPLRLTPPKFTFRGQFTPISHQFPKTPRFVHISYTFRTRFVHVILIIEN